MQKIDLTPNGNTFATPDENFPLAPEGVRDAYKKMWEATHTPPDAGRKLQQQLSITNGLIADFCNTQVPPEVYTAAMLGPIMIQERDPLLTMNARRSLRTFADKYHTSDTARSLRYVYGIGTDGPVISDFWNDWTPEAYEDQPERLELLQDTANSLEVPTKYWTRQNLGMKALSILELRGSVGANIESLLVGGTDSVQRMFSPEAANDTRTLQEVTKAHNLWAPYAEFMGYDGLAMLLQSRAYELQFKNQGNHQALKQAYDIIYSMGDPAVIENRVQQMLKAAFGDHVQERVLGDMMSHGIVVGEALTDANNLRVVWRRKSLGSLARKIATSQNGHLPMDIIGATAIPETPQEIGLNLRSILERLKTDPRAKLTPSPSRNKALHIQGTEEYIDAVQYAMGFRDREELARYATIGSKAYQVAKITFMFQEWGDPLPLHTEIQFNTRIDRLQARIGSYAHAANKLTGESGGIPSRYIKLMQELYDDKPHIGDLGLSPQSGLRSEEFARKIARVTL